MNPVAKREIQFRRKRPRRPCKSPVVACPVCGWPTAIVGTKTKTFARHDPVDRGPLLLSCSNSLEPAPAELFSGPDGTPSLYFIVAEQEPAAPEPSLAPYSAQALFELPAA